MRMVSICRRDVVLMHRRHLSQWSNGGVCRVLLLDFNELCVCGFIWNEHVYWGVVLMLRNSTYPPQNAQPGAAGRSVHVDVWRESLSASVLYSPDRKRSAQEAFFTVPMML